MFYVLFEAFLVEVTSITQITTKSVRRKNSSQISHLVKKHIAKYYEQPEEIFNSVRASESLHSSLTLRNNQVALNIESTAFRSSSPCWVLNCFCCEITSYSSCLIFVTVLFAFFAVAAVLAWYANIPEVTSSVKSNDDWNRAGPYIIGFLLFIAVFSALGAICHFFLKRRYIHLNNDHEDNQIILPSLHNRTHS